MNQPEIVRLKNSVNERDHAVGSKTAPVTLLEYGNFECIHCGRAYPVIKEIQQLLKNDLYFVFRHFPTVQTHPHGLRAAEAAEAAAVQGKFWEMHDELFTPQIRLTIPMLVLTGEKASGNFLIEQARLVDSNVQGVVIKGSGHWLMEEAPGQVIPQLVIFITISI